MQQEPFTGTNPPVDSGPAFPEWAIDTPVHEAIFQAIGAASMCWEHLEAAGVFDSARARQIGEELITLLQMKLWISDPSA